MFWTGLALRGCVATGGRSYSAARHGRTRNRGGPPNPRPAPRFFGSGVRATGRCEVAAVAVNPAQPAGSLVRSRSLSLGQPSICTLAPSLPSRRICTRTAMSAPAPRLKRACSLCAANKAKCDQGRPCYRCIQRGVPEQCMDRVQTRQDRPERKRKAVKACDPCYRSKVACCDERPCGRCVRLNQPEKCTILPRRNAAGSLHRDNRAEPMTSYPSTVPGAPAGTAAPDTPVFAAVIVPEGLRNAVLSSLRRYTTFDIANFILAPTRLNTFLSVIAAVLSRDDLIAFRQSMTSCISAVDAQLESWLASLEPLAVSFDIGTLPPSDALMLQIQIDYSELPVVRYSLLVTERAQALLGYTLANLRALCQSYPRVTDDKRKYAHPFLMLFESSSWSAVVHHAIDVFVLGKKRAVLPVTLLRLDGKVVHCVSTWDSAVTEDGKLFLTTATFEPLL